MRTWLAIASMVTLCFAQCPAEECPSDETVLLQTGFKQKGSVLATQSGAVQKTRSSPDTPAFVGQECCDVDDSSCHQSVDLGGYHSFSECQDGCEGRSGCIGFEFGNDRVDENGRCDENGHCKCWLVVGACNHQHAHVGYNVYLRDGFMTSTPPALSPIHAGHECCDHSSGSCHQSEAFGDYPSFSECWDECRGRSDCIGFEFGNDRNDGYNRCSRDLEDGHCKCWLVVGTCDSPRAHLGYNVYLLGEVTAPYDGCKVGLNDCEFPSLAGISSWFSKANFDEFFPNLDTRDWETDELKCPGAQVLTYNCLIKATLEYPNLFSSGNEDDDKRELAAWMGIMGQETTGGGCGASTELDDSTPQNTKCSCGDMWCDTAVASCSEWGLCNVEEATGADHPYCDCPVDENGQTKCPDDEPNPCVDGQEYKGRGPKQLSWNYNYGQFSEQFCGDKNTLLQHPGWVASSPQLAWASSIWFWSTGGACQSETCKPSPHDVFTGSVLEEEGVGLHRKHGLGWAINIVNGGLECGNAAESQGRCDYRVHSRVNFYKHFCELLDVDPYKNGDWTDENLFCSDQTIYR